MSNGSLPNEGRVEICFDGYWGTICDDGWDKNEARVVCKQLGYVDTADSIAYGNAFYGRGSAPIHLDDMSCDGTENALIDCRHSGVGVHNCVNEEDVGVLCIGELLIAYLKISWHLHNPMLKEILAFTDHIRQGSRLESYFLYLIETIIS